MKLLIFIAIVAVLGVAVFMTADSLVLGLCASIVFIIVWFITANFRSILKGKALKHALKEISVEDKFPSEGEYAEGHMHYLGHKNVVGVYADKEGIYLYSFGICDCKIEWDSIKSLEIEEVGGKLVAKVSVVGGNNLRIPWSNEFTTNYKAQG